MGIRGAVGGRGMREREEWCEWGGEAVSMIAHGLGSWLLSSWSYAFKQQNSRSHAIPVPS